MNLVDLLLEKKDSIATITLNSPDKLNAMSSKMRESLFSAMDDVNKDDSVKVVIVTGAGRGFCAGADLTEFAGAPKAPPTIYEKLAGPPRPSFFRIDKPAICAINGACVGAGLSLALSCDIRIASDKAKLGAAFIKLGASPDNAMSYWLPRLMGTAGALEFLLTGKILVGEEAKQAGLVSKVVPGEELMKAANELAAQMAQYPLIALALTKRLVYRSMIDDVGHHYDWEAWAGQMCRDTKDNQNAMNAFNDKKAPENKPK
jgi:2-(1,2-epoxy-1,2-dihydrophenyl)acetyl-CoA isomerase